jgi:CDGSH-type Zn-finger protein/uncharacterized Fe-S cluster protein YjdI
VREDLHHYRGADVDVTFDAERCVHVRACVEGLPDVFDADRRPWVDPDAADADAVRRVVESCPTGALTHDGDEATPDRNVAVVVADGPVHLRGDLRLLTPDGDRIARETRVALCRCGHTANRPLCDGSHERTFEAAGVDPAGAVEAALDAAEGDPHGPLDVTLRRDGPVHLDGEFTLVRPDADEMDETALCRCGASPNKPFCDGTHESVGWETEADGT